MGRLIYDLGIWVYSIVIYVVSPFNRKAKTFLKGRKNLFQQIAVRLKDNNKPVAWFHCASLGEFEQARPVIEAFKEKYPTYFWRFPCKYFTVIFFHFSTRSTI